ncbi:permease prefix domain 1-containing protein [Oceanobacillus sp. CFH 90083]|uniref:permease prefix domain 1-containing protein n=1 Tax=Oceanobacillus sp. CFH 90083 TaxID=2592336 RepID=UPI001D153DCF|nr:permease prefix domain 1-containing protein [Oceanobacillus sp. CFH 90083]
MMIKKYVDDLFQSYESTPELEDFKEEIMMNLKDRVQDLEKKGKSSDEAFAEAVAELGDITAIADDLSREKRKEIIGKMYVDTKPKLSAGYAIGYTLAAGVLLFGIITSLITYFSTGDNLFIAISSLLPFVVPAGAALTYLGLTTETTAKYPMHWKRALIYTLAVGLILFGISISSSQYFMENSDPAAILGVLIPFVLPGILVIAFLILTEKKRFKPWLMQEHERHHEAYTGYYKDTEEITKRGMLSGALWIGTMGVFLIIWILTNILYALPVFLFAIVGELLIEYRMISKHKRNSTAK